VWGRVKYKFSQMWSMIDRNVTQEQFEEMVLKASSEVAMCPSLLT
jgi:hypothetical protein